MKQYHFNLQVAYVSEPSRIREETYVKSFNNEDEIENWGREAVKNYNENLRVGEIPRVYKGYKILSSQALEDEPDQSEVQDDQHGHTWVQMGEPRTVRKSEIVDYKCSVCGAWARTKDGGDVTRAYGYEPEVYSTCESTIAHLNK